MKLTIALEMDSAAFGNDNAERGQEAARILRVIASQIEHGTGDGDKMKVRDHNGNYVALMEVAE
jgi:hypothetical protein